MTLRPSRIALSLAVALMLALVPIDAQQSSPQRAPGTITEGVRVVLVDVVVRDRNGQPVRDLTQADLEVLEDGTPQTISSFAPVFDGTPASGPSTPSAAVPAAGAAPPVNTGPPVMALVFDRLSPEARRLAVRAAQQYVGNDAETADYVGIFGVDLSLTPYAPYTRSGHVLRQALSKMANSASSGSNAVDAQRRDADRRAASTSSATAAAGEAASGPGASAAVGTAPAQAALAQMQSQIVTDFELMERDQQGYSTTNGLFAIINALRGIPGRKGLVLFSEGVAIPPAVQRLFRGVIDAANRANVSVYTIDAVGLRAESEQAKIRDQVNQAAGAGIGTAYAGGGGSEPLTKMMEKNEDVLRQDPRSGLGELARDTGGFLLENTNNLRQGFDRVGEDLRNYYLVGYAPADDVFDGRFRTIQVRVRRPGVTVAARKGYFAIRDTGGLPVNTWEALALGALERKPVPNAFPVRAGAMLFPEPARPGLVPVVVEVGTAPLTFQPTPDGKSYTSDFAVVVRFLDQQNKVVRKVSQHYEVRGPVADLESARNGTVIFYREPELRPGVYTMESVVHDAPSGKSSVRLSTIEVPPADTGRLRVSSLVLVKRVEQVPDKERRPDNPLLVNDLLIYPNLGEAVSKAAKEIGFYFAAYPVKGGPAPEASIELLQNGAPVAQLAVPLAAADPSGRIQQVGRLPLEQLAAGVYELRTVVRQGAEQVSRSTILRLVQ